MRTEAVVNFQGQPGYLTKGKVIFKLAKLLICIFKVLPSKCTPRKNGLLSILFYWIDCET